MAIYDDEFAGTYAGDYVRPWDILAEARKREHLRNLMAMQAAQNPVETGSGLDRAGALLRKQWNGMRGVNPNPQEQALMMRGFQPAQAAVTDEGPTAAQRELLQRFRSMGPEALSQRPNSYGVGAGGAAGRAKARDYQQAQHTRADQFRQKRAEQLQQMMQARQFMRLDPRVQAAVAQEAMQGQRLTAQSAEQKRQFDENLRYNRERMTSESRERELDRLNELERARIGAGSRGRDAEQVFAEGFSKWPTWVQAEYISSLKTGQPVSPEAAAIMKNGGVAPPAAPKQPEKPKKPGLISEVLRTERETQARPLVPKAFILPTIEPPLYSY